MTFGTGNNRIIFGLKLYKIFPFMMVHMPYVIIPPSELKELDDSSPLPDHLKQVFPILHIIFNSYKLLCVPSYLVLTLLFLGTNL